MLLGGKCSRWVEGKTGLTQGYPLLPVLYSVYEVEMLMDLEEKKVGN